MHCSITLSPNIASLVNFCANVGAFATPLKFACLISSTSSDDKSSFCITEECSGSPGATWTWIPLLLPVTHPVRCKLLGTIRVGTEEGSGDCDGRTD